MKIFVKKFFFEFRREFLPPTPAVTLDPNKRGTRGLPIVKILLSIAPFRMLFFKEFSESMANFEKGLEPQTLFEKIHFASLGWKVPVSAAILYAVIVTIWGRCNKAKALKAEEPRVKAKKNAEITKNSEDNRFSFFNCMVIAHNVFLTVFSAYCFVCIVKILIESYFQDNFLDAVKKKDFIAVIDNVF